MTNLILSCNYQMFWYSIHNKAYENNQTAKQLFEKFLQVYTIALVVFFHSGEKKKKVTFSPTYPTESDLLICETWKKLIQADKQKAEFYLGKINKSLKTKKLQCQIDILCCYSEKKECR